MNQNAGVVAVWAPDRRFTGAFELGLEQPDSECGPAAVHVGSTA
jgi:hypothetical protein